jgi:hypothetical protein
MHPASATKMEFAAMAPPTSTYRDDSRTFLSWFAAFPFLAAWPFLSFFPLISLLNGAGTTAQMVVQGLLLASGFWGAGAAYCGAKLLAGTEKARATLTLGRGAVFAYVITWTVIWCGVRYAL